MPSLPNLNIKQRLATQFLASGLTREQTAKRIGVDVTTISKWRRIAGFEEAICTLLQQHEQEAIHLLQALRLKAVERLAELIESKNQSVSLRAIEAVLKQPKIEIPPPIDSEWIEVRKELERLSKLSDLDLT